MRIDVTWKDGMLFEGHEGDHAVAMDAKRPFGKESAPSPKDLVAMGLGGCTAMDVIALLKKNKQTPKNFNVAVEIQSSTGAPPVVFTSAMLTFTAEGEINPETLVESVKLSQTRYCGVSAMLSLALPIEYKIVLNGKEIATGIANF